jgi:spermidine synthase
VSSAPASTFASRPWLRPTVAAIFLASGASGLAYEVLWARQLGFVLGGSAIAISTITATFMAGLGLGGFLGGRVADRSRRPLVAYGLVELGIGLAGLLTPSLLSASGTIYLGLYGLLAGSLAWVTLARALATAAILIVPTTLMGASLPLMARFYIRRIDRVGRGLGVIYGLNVLGGVLGAAFVGYYSIQHNGVYRSLELAAAVNGIAAAAALLLGAWLPPLEKDASEDAAPGPAAVEAIAGATTEAEAAAFRKVAIIGFGASGFTALAYEVLWTRALSFAIGNSVYAFTTILVVFLTGLFLGALLAGVVADRTRAPLRMLGAIQVASAGLMLLAFSQARRLPLLTGRLVHRLGPGLVHNLTAKITAASLALLVPTIVIGLTFPFILKIAMLRLQDLGHRLGECYAINTGGSILGSVAAGFVLLPTLGLLRGMFVVALVNVLTGIAFFMVSERPAVRRPLVAAGALASLGLVAAAALAKPSPFILSTPRLLEEPRTILFHREGSTASVAVSELDDRGRVRNVQLHVNLLGSSEVDAEYHHQQYFATLSLLPAALHPNPAKVFVAGIASGVTTGAAGLDERTQEVISVEISPEVVEAASFFDRWNYHATRTPKIHLLADDARAYLATTKERFDVIVTDVFISAVTGTAALYSREYFDLCRSRLAPGGYMSVGGDRLRGVDRVVARTLLESFPYAALFVVRDRDVYCRSFLIAANEPIQFTADSIAKAYAQESLRRELTRYRFPSAQSIVEAYVCNREELLAEIRDAEISTDDRPVIDARALDWAEGFAMTRGEEGPGVEAIRRKYRSHPPFVASLPIAGKRTE